MFHPWAMEVLFSGSQRGNRPPLCDNVEPCNRKAKTPCLLLGKRVPHAQEPSSCVYTLQEGRRQEWSRGERRLCSQPENSYLTSAKHRVWHLNSCRSWGHQALSTYTFQCSHLSWASLKISLDLENWFSGVTPKCIISGELSCPGQFPQSGIWTAYPVKFHCLLPEATPGIRGSSPTTDQSGSLEQFSHL